MNMAMPYHCKLNLHRISSTFLRSISHNDGRSSDVRHGNFNENRQHASPERRQQKKNRTKENSNDCSSASPSSSSLSSLSLPPSVYNGSKNSNHNGQLTRESNFDEFFADHQRRARRSILVRFMSQPRNFEETYAEICKELRNADVLPVDSVYSSKILKPHSPDGQKTFFLLETSSRSALDKFIYNNARSAVSDCRMVPSRTRILHFTGRLSHSRSSKFTDNSTGSGLKAALRHCLWLDEQMRVLVDHTTLNDEGVRLRFFVSSLIEDALRGVFPFSVCKPFGSSTNGFGHLNSDLDMDFMLEDSSFPNAHRSKWLCAFSVKEENERRHTQNMIELFGRMLRFCMPYCVDVNRITKARVPIVKFRHTAAGLGCDLTVGNITGPMFTKILWMYSQCDIRIRPLVFAVRRWAASVGITRDIPGDWLTNFQLMCLVIFYLQTRQNGPALPSIRRLKQLSSATDDYGIVSNTGVVVKELLHDMHKQSSNDSGSLSDLLREFFRFVAQRFDFDRLMINLETGSAEEKTDNVYPLYIHNPLEKDHNIARNVTEKQLFHFRRMAENALRLMETTDLMDRGRISPHEKWGLLSLFDRTLYGSDERWASGSSVLIEDYLLENVNKANENKDSSDEMAFDCVDGNASETTAQASSKDFEEDNSLSAHEYAGDVSQIDRETLSGQIRYLGRQMTHNLLTNLEKSNFDVAAVLSDGRPRVADVTNEAPDVRITRVQAV